MSVDVMAEGLVKRWDGVPAVDEVFFSAPAGSLTVLLGPSGCGKSTLLRLIAGLERADAGRVVMDGRDVTHADAARRGVSMVFQSYALFPHLNVAENIGFGLRVRRVPSAERRRRVSDAAEMVGLENLLDRKPAQLSGGQRQRVALARTIVAEQPVCLMDEPLSNLDARLRATMRDEIRDLHKRLGLTMIYVTHDQTEAMSMADQIILLDAGRIEQAGPPAELYERPATAFAACFIGTPPMNLIDVQETGRQIGIRPEHVYLADDGITAEITAVDYLGAETVVRLDHSAGRVMARLNGRAACREGDHVKFAWRAADAHLFDHTGSRQDGPETSLSVSAAALQRPADHPSGTGKPVRYVKPR